MERVSLIRSRLIEQGDLPKPEKSAEAIERERLQAELDRLFPNAESKRVVDHKGERYTRRYVPLATSNSGKTVKTWHGFWERIAPPTAKP
jgi:hypothetical protein